jgi:hypothetical protein
MCHPNHPYDLTDINNINSICKTDRTYNRGL